MFGTRCFSIQLLLKCWHTRGVSNPHPCALHKNARATNHGGKLKFESLLPWKKDARITVSASLLISAVCYIAISKKLRHIWTSASTEDTSRHCTRVHGTPWQVCYTRFQVTMPLADSTQAICLGGHSLTQVTVIRNIKFQQKQESSTRGDAATQNNQL